MKRPILVRAGVGLAAVALVATACGGSSSGGTATKPVPMTTHGSTTPTTQNGAATAAADLRAGLTSLLQEHVSLAGVAFQTAFATGLDSKQTAGAVAALDQNSVALSQAVGSVYGDAGGKQFLELWRKHIGFFVEYAKGAATNDAALKAKAAKELDGYRADFGAFLESATKGALTKDAVAMELTGHVQTLEAAIDALATKSPSAAEKLRMAEDHMPMTAKVLATTIVAQFPDKFAG